MEITLSDSPTEEYTASRQSVILDLSNGESQNECNEQTVQSVKVLSKREQRRLIKHKKWLEMKPLRRAKKKEKVKKKKEELKLLNIKKTTPSRNELKNKKMAFSNCKLSVVLDFSFDHLMNHKDICKSVKQLSYCYSINRRSENPLQFHVTDFNGTSKDEMQRHLGYTNWDVNFHEKGYMDIFSKGDLIYLTSDSENVISKLDENKVYIIGGLVDHNSHKGLCLNIAKEHGISHGRLPIKEYLDMKTRDVLSIAHVFEILVLVISGLSWPEALMKVIPQRKGAIMKSQEMDCESKKTQDVKPES